MTEHQPSAAVDQTRAAVEEIADHAFRLARGIADHVTTAISGRPAPRRADLGGVEDLVTEALSDPDEPVQGAGFVAAVGLLDDARWWLEWFVSGIDARVQRLVTHSEPQSIGFYDYESLPWFVVPRDTGRNHVTGPYVDYLCTEEYTLTFTIPVVVDDRFAGVAGADISVRSVERFLLPPLCAADTGLAVVNAEGRILASNSGRHVCGDLLPGGGDSPYPMAGLPLSIVGLPTRR